MALATSNDMLPDDEFDATRREVYAQHPATPVVDLDEGLRAKRVDPALCVLADIHQPGLPQHSEMPGHAGASDRERLSQLPCARRVLAEDLQHGAPALVCQRVPHGVHER